MKKASFFTFILLITCLIAANAQNYKDIDGWEFLPWKTDKENVQKILAENKDKLSDPYAFEADFNYQEMNTWLEYTKNNQLINVSQKKEFSVIYNEEAAAFYEKCKSRLISHYGEPDSIADNKTDSTVNLNWKLKYTSIALNYDYRYKIIDEFGAGSYWVKIVFEAIKKD
jgi:hypothetical protein